MWTASAWTRSSTWTRAPRASSPPSSTSSPQRIGKENFYLIGEITGGRAAGFYHPGDHRPGRRPGHRRYPRPAGVPGQGLPQPAGIFRPVPQLACWCRRNSHIWFRNKVVTLFDDHDQVRKGGHKARFCAGDPAWPRLLLNVLALNATTLGIPCIYYGSEQGFDGEGDNDRYIREAMFGGEFGAFRSRERHFFDEEHPVYQELAQNPGAAQAEDRPAPRPAVPARDLRRRAELRPAAPAGRAGCSPWCPGRALSTTSSCCWRSTPTPTRRARPG